MKHFLVYARVLKSTCCCLLIDYMIFFYARIKLAILVKIYKKCTKFLLIDMVSSQILIFIIVIAIVMVFRFRRMLAGGTVNKNRIILAMVSYFGISLFVVFSSFQVGVSIWYVFAYAGMLIGATYLSHKFVRDGIKIWKSDDGKIHAKGGNIPYVIWLVGLVSRFTLGYIFIGPDYLMITYGSQKTLGTLAVEVTLIVDLIMMLGVGALAGRNINLISKIKNFKT